MALINCIGCNSEISEHATECVHCGRKVYKILSCPECNSIVTSDSETCEKCGYPFKHFEKNKSSEYEISNEDSKFKFSNLDRNVKISLIAGILSFFFVDFLLPQVIAIYYGFPIAWNRDEDPEPGDTFKKHNDNAALIGCGLGLLYIAVFLYNISN